MDQDYFSNSRFVTELTPKDFNQVATWKLKNHKCSIVMFYLPTCPYCKAMKDIWEELGETAAFFDVCAFNCGKYRTHLNKIKNDMPHLVNGFPTMIIYENGSPIEQVGETEEERNVSYFTAACMRACKG